MAYRFTRPNLPYSEVVLPNNKRYELLTQQKRPVSAELLDAEFNYTVDSLNALDTKIDNAVAGSIPGADDPLNAGKTVTTDGDNNLSWVFVNNSHIEDNTISGNKLISETVTSGKLASASVLTSKIYDLAVTNDKIASGVDGAKLLDGSVHFNKLGLTASPNTVLKSNAASETSFAKIDGNEMEDGAVGTREIAEFSIQRHHISIGAVTDSEITAGVQLAKISAPSDVGGRKVLCSSTTSPYMGMRSLERADLPAITNDDLPVLDRSKIPQIGMQPVYMVRWDISFVSSSVSFSIAKSYNPFNIVQSFTRASKGTYRIYLGSSGQSGDYICVGNPIGFSSNNAGWYLLPEHSGNYINIYSFLQTAGQTAQLQDHAGELIVYKIA